MKRKKYLKKVTAGLLTAAMVVGLCCVGGGRNSQVAVADADTSAGGVAQVKNINLNVGNDIAGITDPKKEQHTLNAE